MIRALAATIMFALVAGSIAYAGLLTNWFRYGPSLEAVSVLVALIVGTLISLLFAALAYAGGTRRSLLGTILVTAITGGLIVAAQMHVFGRLPSWYTQHVERSPAGRLGTPPGQLEYWIELENPFAHAHQEYLLVRRGAEEIRVRVPIFNGPVAGYVSPLTAADWGRLVPTGESDVFVLTLGPSLPREGRFRVDLRTRLAGEISER